MPLTQIEQGMLKDGILTADTAGRLKMADGFVNDAKIAGMAASKLTGQVPDANAPSGSVIQVVGANGVGASGSNTSYAATSLAATITTTLANSKIVAGFAFSSQSQGGGASLELALRFSGDSYASNLWEGMNYSYSGAWSQSAGHPLALHSPNVPAGTALTYKMYAKATGGSWYINDQWGRMSGLWTAVLMEIAP